MGLFYRVKHMDDKKIQLEIFTKENKGSDHFIKSGNSIMCDHNNDIEEMNEAITDAQQSIHIQGTRGVMLGVPLPRIA